MTLRLMKSTSSVDIIVLSIIFFILILPGAFFKDFSLYEILPPSSVRYELWLISINIVDIFIVTLSSLVMLISKKTYEIKFLIVMSCFIISSIYGALIQAYNGFDGQVFIDGYISFFRLIFILIFFYFFLTRSNSWSIVRCIIFSLLFLCLVSMMAVLFGGFEGIMGGRINLLGMGVNVSSDALLIGTFLILWSRFYFPKVQTNHIALNISLVIFFFMIVLTGSRRAILFYFLVIILFKYFSKTGIDKIKMILKSSFVLPTVSLSIFLFANNYAESLNLQGFIRLLTILDSLSEDGRFGMYEGAIKLITKYPYGLGLSDWAIQQELGHFTVGSHTHNFVFQWYLKFGFSIIFLLFPIIFIFKACWSNPVFFAIWIPIFINNMTGYGYWNYKYCFLIGFLVMFTLYSGNRNSTRKTIPRSYFLRSS